MADGAALELGLTGLDLEREAAMRIRAPRLVPQPVGTVPDPFRTLTSGESFLPRVVNQVRASTLLSSDLFFDIDASTQCVAFVCACEDVKGRTELVGCNAGLDAVIVCELDAAAVLARAAGARLDPRTGRTYNIDLLPPPSDDPGLAARLQALAPYSLLHPWAHGMHQSV